MLLHPNTVLTIEQLDKIGWFCNVGKVMEYPNPNSREWVVPCQSWEEAIESGLGVDWENVRLEAVNELREKLTQVIPSLLGTWNDTCDLVAPEAKRLAHKAINQNISERYKENLLPHLEWDISSLLLEAQYSEVVKPHFFANLAYFYKAGRYPCGRVNETKLLVF
jgi:hypothetical protein